MKKIVEYWQEFLVQRWYKLYGLLNWRHVFHDTIIYW